MFAAHGLSVGVGKSLRTRFAGFEGAGGWFGWPLQAGKAHDGGAAFAGGLFVFG